MMSHKELFWALFNAKNEQDVDKLIARDPDIFRQENWHPLGENESNFGVVENRYYSGWGQQ
ncbi:MAG: hypothetical protein JW725_05255 [Candidatus Babeliaceae bacterium]|nr:hypothetical protein [Candidatus Babeliaceae bacterium]